MVPAGVSGGRLLEAVDARVPAVAPPAYEVARTPEEREGRRPGVGPGAAPGA